MQKKTVNTASGPEYKYRGRGAKLFWPCRQVERTARSHFSHGSARGYASTEVTGILRASHHRPPALITLFGGICRGWFGLIPLHRCRRGRPVLADRGAAKPAPAQESGAPWSWLTAAGIRCAPSGGDGRDIYMTMMAGLPAARGRTRNSQVNTVSAGRKPAASLTAAIRSGVDTYVEVPRETLPKSLFATNNWPRSLAARQSAYVPAVRRPTVEAEARQAGDELPSLARSPACGRGRRGCAGCGRTAACSGAPQAGSPGPLCWPPWSRSWWAHRSSRWRPGGGPRRLPSRWPGPSTPAALRQCHGHPRCRPAPAAAWDTE